MRCRLADLRMKEVINIATGFRLGYVCDVVVNVANGQLVAIVVPGRCRVWGLFGREDDYVIPWDMIRKIGDDIILVDCAGELRRERRPKRPWFC